ncbi:MAG: VanZ family protein, partial [Phycisphaerae bacterium]
PVPQASWYWAAAVIGAVLYGSLIPFTIDISQLSAGGGFGVFAIAWHGTTVEDLVTNLALYVPIGALVSITGRMSRRSACVRVLAAVWIGLCVSLLAEALQTTMAVRVASWTDVVLNVVGAGLGAWMGWAVWRAVLRGLGALRTALQRAPCATLASLLLFGLVFERVMPFDFVSTTAGLHASFSQAAWQVLAVPVDGSVGAFAPVASGLSGAGWFFALSYLSVLGYRQAGRVGVAAFLLAVRRGVIVVVVTEVLQLFTVSRVFRVSDMTWCALGVGLGACTASLLLVVRGAMARERRLRVAVPTGLLVLSGLVQAGAMLVTALDARTWTLGAAGLAGIARAPFALLWREPMFAAFAAIVGTTTRYALLAVAVAVGLRRARLAGAWGATGALVMVVAMGVAGLSAVMVHAAVDLTGPVLALVAVVAVAQVYPVVRPARSRAGGGVSGS